MDRQLYTLNINRMDSLDDKHKQCALTALESGKVVHLPDFVFQSPLLSMPEFFSDALLDGKHKNVSFDYRTGRLGGFRIQIGKPELPEKLSAFMQGFASFARQLTDTLFPQYSHRLQWGRTSYRPAEIKDRPSSKRKDDSRLHVDSFAASPVNGHRILRIFCNINPDAQPRVWHLGEPFSDVLRQFSARIPAYSASVARLLKLVRATKTLRSAYDHYQLHLHDSMKLDDNYQKNVKKFRMDFPAQSTWLVFTDQVSHAALSGQFLLEQTFYLPVSAMATPELSPLKYWEQEKQIHKIVKTE